MLFHRLAGAMAGAALTFGLAAAQPAWAQLDVQIDTEFVEDNFNPARCSLGSASCDSFHNLGFSVSRPDGTTFDRVYLYREGVVGLGAPLPETASVAGGLASLGDAYLAPGLGDYAGMDISLRFSRHGGYNHSLPDDVSDLVVIWWDVGDPNRDGFNANGEPDPSVDYAGVFQIALRSFAYGAGQEEDGRFPLILTGNPDVDVRLGYGGAYYDQLAGTRDAPGLGITGSEQIGYRLGGRGARFDPLGRNGPEFTLRPDATIPEPGTWALMIGGFGLVGGALRRRRAPTLA